MTLALERRWVDEVARQLLAPLLRQPLSRSGWRLLSWDAEQGLQVNLQRGETVLLIELEARDEARPCYERTRLFNLTVRRQFEGATPLTDEHRPVTQGFARMIRRQEAALELPERTTARRRTLVRTIAVDRVLIPEGPGHYYINPYVGCMIGCSFCYVMERADLSRRLEGLPRMPWGHWADVKADAPLVLREEVKRHAPGVVRMSPIITDPYMPLERHFRVTRGCLEVLLEAGFAPVVLTRAARVVEDLPLLERFAGHVAVGLSIPTDEDRWRQVFEPGADPVEARLAALETLHAAGVPVFAVIQPMLPMNAVALAERLAGCVRAVRIDRMHDLWRVKHLYDAAGIAWAAEDAFFERTEAALRARFAELGVPVDDMDDLAPLIARS
jgi:DNA repair photolyase